MADDTWKEDGTCRRKMHDYVAAGWTFERAQNYVTGLFYEPTANGETRGRPKNPKARTAEDDPFCLPRLWCAACPVRARCLEEAVDGGDAFGFRAGLVPHQLRGLIKDRRRAARHLRALAAVPG